MCIFCGGQCGGVGEFFISLGLPFLVLYFYRIKNALLRLKNRLLHRNWLVEDQENEEESCSCYGETLGNSKTLSFQAVDPKLLEMAELDSHVHAAKFNEIGITPKRAGVLGVSGWLLVLCINLTIIIPFSCLYNAISGLQIVYFPSTRNQLLIMQQSIMYHIIIIFVMLFLASFSLYAGMRLWEVKPKAVMTAKVFLISQLLLIFLIMAVRPWLVFPLSGEPAILGILRSLIPYLSYFGVWFLYLTFSKRVHNTYVILTS
jgi:hypothetical protein